MHTLPGDDQAVGCQWPQLPSLAITDPDAAADADAVSLADLARRHGSDKADHGYAPLYEERLRGRRFEPLRLLEIGVGGYADPSLGGASLRMWADYLPNARIVGLDVHQKDLDLPDRVTVVQGSQAAPDVLDALDAEHGPFDVVIDDGSHHNTHRNATFAHLFPRVVPGGFYALEDLHTSYLRFYGGDPRDLATPSTTNGLLKTLLDGLHHAYVPGRRPAPLDTAVTSVCLHPKIAFVARGENRPTVPWNDRRAIDDELERLRADDERAAGQDGSQTSTSVPPGSQPRNDA